MFQPDGVPDEIKYDGISGWLLVFCITLFLNPALYLIDVIRRYRELQLYIDMPAAFYSLNIMLWIFNGIFMILSIYVGIKILNRAPEAPKYSKSEKALHEIQQPKRKKILINYERLKELLGFDSYEQVKTAHKRWVESCLSDGDNFRDGKWRESIAACPVKSCFPI